MFEIREKPEMVERAMLVSIYFDPSGGWGKTGHAG